MKSPASRHGEPMDTLAVPAVETREVLSDGALKTLAPGHLAPDGPGRHTELSTASWSESSRVLAHHLFS